MGRERTHSLEALLLALLLVACALVFAPGTRAYAEPEADAQEVQAEQADSEEAIAEADAAEQDQAQEGDEPAEEAGQPAEPAEATSGAKEAQEAAEKAAKKKKIGVSVRFVGTDGTWFEQKRVEVDEGASAWDATREVLATSGLSYRTGTESTTDVLVSVSRDKDGASASLDSATGSGWHLYLNGNRYLGSSSSLTLAEGDDVEWRYEVGSFMVSVCVVGPGGANASYWIAPTSVRMQANQTVWDASLAVFAQNGYDEGRLFSYTTGEDGSVSLDSLSSLGENGITGEAWQLFVNGTMPEEDAAHVLLHAGDSICWYYAGKGEFALPSFVEQTGGASQNPASTISIEGAVAQAWNGAAPLRGRAYTMIDRLLGLAVAGRQESPSLVSEPSSALDPLAQLMCNTGWRSSLAHTLDVKLGTGEGVRSVMGADKSLYYVSPNGGSIVKLELQS